MTRRGPVRHLLGMPALVAQVVTHFPEAGPSPMSPEVPVTGEVALGQESGDGGDRVRQDSRSQLSRQVWCPHSSERLSEVQSRPPLKANCVVYLEGRYRPIERICR